MAKFILSKLRLSYFESISSELYERAEERDNSSIPEIVEARRDTVLSLYSSCLGCGATWLITHENEKGQHVLEIGDSRIILNDYMEDRGIYYIITRPEALLREIELCGAFPQETSGISTLLWASIIYEDTICMMKEDADDRRPVC